MGDGADLQQQCRGSMMWALYDFVVLLDNADIYLTTSQAERACWLGNHFLLFYQKLAGHAYDKNESRYKLRPKFHYFAELLRHMKRTKQNPRRYHLFTAEDFMGRVKHIGRKCHKRTVCKRIVQRLIVFYLHTWYRERRGQKRKR